LGIQSAVRLTHIFFPSFFRIKMIADLASKKLRTTWRNKMVGADNIAKILD